ncbi:MAG: glycosyltransferase [Flavobacteriales bacterium]|nr:glycosyltransferase [Flavobacteriales bacterium]
MNRKPDILIFIDWFFPGFKAGGPIKSVSNIVNALHSDFNFFIITSDRDIDDPEPYKNTPLNTWIEKEKYKIAYLSPEKRQAFIRHTINNTDFDVYYFNSLYSKPFTLDPFRLIKKTKKNPKLIIAPRGMLGKGALKIKALKKKVFLTVTKVSGFFQGVSWHATDAEEVEDIQLAFGNKTSIVQVPNIALIKIREHLIKKSKGNLKLVFFSRITPKKNLYYALELLQQLSNEHTISLAIYGSIEDQAYWEKCNAFIQKNHLNAEYHGVLVPELVKSILCEYHFLLLPTLHENYGHVIAEALTAGCGLIISTNTPWRDLDRIEVGWDSELSRPEDFRQAILKAYEMDQITYDRYRANCYTFIEQETQRQNAVELTKKMFLERF